MTADLLEATDFELLVEDFEEPEYECESVLHMVDWKMPAHPAAWFAGSACGSFIAVCEERRRQCRREGSWKCVRGCTGTHEYDQIDWTPVKP